MAQFNFSPRERSIDFLEINVSDFIAPCLEVIQDSLSGFSGTLTAPTSITNQTMIRLIPACGSKLTAGYITSAPQFHHSSEFSPLVKRCGALEKNLLITMIVRTRP
jgi:hypothetical protein